MAKKAKSASKRAARKTEPDQPQETPPAARARRIISGQKLKSLLSSCRTAEQEVSEISGSIGSELKTAVEKHGLDKEMFGVLKKLNRYRDDPVKLNRKLEDLNHYIEASGLNDIAEKAPGLDFGPGDGESEEDADPGDNVSEFPRAHANAAE